MYAIFDIFDISMNDSMVIETLKGEVCMEARFLDKQF